MLTRYAPLFRIELRHDYFADDLCKPLSLHPTADCRRLLDRYGCLYKAAPGGGVVACPVGPANEMLPSYTDSAPFSFDLRNADPRLSSYTETAAVAGVASEHLYYFDNLGAFADAGDDAILLHLPGQALAAGPLAVRAKRHTQRIEKPAPGARASLLGALGDAPVWQSAELAADANTLAVDLADYPDGRYRLRVGKRTEADFYSSDATAAARWGVLAIFPGGPEMADLPEAQRPLTADGRIQTRTFVVRLTRRASIWRYFIVAPGSAGHAYDEHQIEAAARRDAATVTPYRFEERAAIRLNGQSARVFESTRPIALCERPADAYEFVFKSSGRAERSGPAFRLPYARPEGTRLEAGTGNDASRMVSEIYVYL